MAAKKGVKVMSKSAPAGPTHRLHIWWEGRKMHKRLEPVARV